MNRMRVLYITYDGLMEPLGQSQIFQYLQGLALHHQISLISYEKPSDWTDTSRLKCLKEEVHKFGIEWIPLQYHKRPSSLATSYDLAVGLILSAYLTFNRRIQVVHARSYVPAVMALGLKKMFGVRFVFDMRGFWADQRIECGAWPRNSSFYHVAKWFERRFLRDADVVVSLTHAGVAVMREFSYLRDSLPRFEVIPTCTNLELFHPENFHCLGNVENGRPFVLGFVGSLGPWYTFDLMLGCFNVLRELRPDAKFHIVNQQSHAYIRERVEAAGIPQACVEIKATGYPGVAHEIRKMDAGLFFLKPFPSFKAVAPTKLGEFLASGIPCLSNAGIGDLEEILEGSSVGVILREYSRQGMEEAMRRLLALTAQPETRGRCVEVARRHFSLKNGVETYDRIYRSLDDSPISAIAR